MQLAGEKKRFRENAFSKGPPLRFSLILGHFFQIFKFPKFDQIWPDLTELDPIRLNLTEFDQNLTKFHKIWWDFIKSDFQTPKERGRVILGS